MSRMLKQPSISVRKPKPRVQTKDETEEETNLKVGQRVTIPTLDNTTGILRYVGKIDQKPGTWAGIELDEKGQGKNDGSAQGKKYFTCAPKSGIFIGTNKVVVLPSLPPSVPISKPSTSTRRSNLPITRNGSTHTSTPRMKPSNSSTTSNGSLKKQSILRSSAIPATSNVKRPPSVTRPASATRPASTTRPPSVARSPSTTRSSSSPVPPPLSSSAPTTSFVESPVLPPSQKPTLTPSTQTKKPQTPTPSTPTPPPPPATITVDEHQETTNQLYEMLEKVQRERDQLLAQMKTKETAWERLVSSRESLSLQVQENESRCQRLSKELESAQNEVEQLRNGLAERDASLAKNQRDEEKTSQDQKRIERLEALVRDLQNQLQVSKDEQLQLSRDHAGILEQVRREVSSNEAMTASLEKECEELRRTSLEAIRAYEGSLLEINEKHGAELKQREQQIQQLEYTIADLRHKQSTLFDDDEQDIDTRLNEMRHASMNPMADQRHRLEEQLELAMTELDHERHSIQTLQQEMDQLKLELSQARQQSLSAEQKYENLQAEFAKELNDKKRLIEEADNAFEAQARAEDEHYQIKLSKMALEKEFNALSEAHKQLEQDYNHLMDDMLALEKQDLQNPMDSAVTPDTARLQEKVQQLERENESHRHSLSAEKKQVSQLSKDLAELESLVESRVFGEADLEEQLNDERKKVIALQKELDAIKNRTSIQTKDVLASPMTLGTPSPTLSPNQKHQDQAPKYCELCESEGHTIMECKSELSLSESKLFCENCDDFGDHVTEECPNQDETF